MTVAEPAPRAVAVSDIVEYRAPDVASAFSRVVGMPGDTVGAHDGQLYRNGAAVTEPYLAAGVYTSDFEDAHVPTGSYFLVGDNRRNSRDSRVLGPITSTAITGLVTRTDNAGDDASGCAS